MKHLKSPLTYRKYRLPEGRDIYLTNRPDCVRPEEISQFIKNKRPIVRFSFTDDFIPYPKRPTNFWIPWFPGQRLTWESVFSFLCQMDFFIKVSSKKRPIWLHCDSSSMRAPTFFGHFLFSRYDKRTVDKIIASVSSRLRSPQLYENPITYAHTSWKLDPGIKELVKAWKAGGEELAKNLFESSYL